jgi:hypothetical protein
LNLGYVIRGGFSYGGDSRFGRELGSVLDYRVVLADEIGPEPKVRSCIRKGESITHLQASYADQQMAVLGIVVTTLGLTPLKNPLSPSL